MTSIQPFHRTLLGLFVAVSAFGALPAEGVHAPDFALKTLEGKTVRLSEATAEGRVVLVVLRGFPGYQCPYCNLQAQDYIKNQQGFKDAGVRVILVYPGPPGELDARAAEFLNGKPFPANFDLVLDPGYVFTNLYGLRWDAPKETAYPSTFLIDNKGMVFFARTSKVHAGRITAAEVLGQLTK